MRTTVGPCAECTLTVLVEVVNQHTYNVIHTHTRTVHASVGQGAVDEQCMRSSYSVHAMYINCILVTMYMNTIY